jgi:hypothetical protein
MSHGVLVWLPKTKQGFGRSIVLLRLFSKRYVFFLTTHKLVTDGLLRARWLHHAANDQTVFAVESNN